LSFNIVFHPARATWTQKVRSLIRLKAPSGGASYL